MTNRGLHINRERIMHHVRVLSEDIGPRLAGSAQEQQAADYVQQQMNDLGLQDVEQQSFPCKWYDVKSASLQARFGGEWECVTMDAVAHTPSTDGVIEAPLVYVETATDEILGPLDLEGKVALVHGTYGPNSRMLKALKAKEVAAVIWTDVRYTADWNILVGLPFTFLHLLTFPAASVPHPTAWDLVARGADRVRLQMQTTLRDETSQNVVGVLPGDGTPGGVLISGHHDSVRGCRGAEDNAAGSAVVLAIAEALRGKGFAKPIKFVSFGTEEQLSQGAFAFADRPGNCADALDMVLNIDGQGCWTGENEIYVTGSDGLHDYMRAQMQASGWPGVIRDEPDGFSDHFPFIVKDVPAAWFHRRNCAGGRWFHHSIHDTIDALSPDVLGSCADLVARIAVDIAGRNPLPYERAFPERVKAEVKKVADGWLNP